MEYTTPLIPIRPLFFSLLPTFYINRTLCCSWIVCGINVIDVDYLKYDNCGRGPPEWQPRFNRMRDALLKYWTHHPILYALCEWGEDDVWKWGNETGHSWRISLDIWAYFLRIPLWVSRSSVKSVFAPSRYSYSFVVSVFSFLWLVL